MSKKKDSPKAKERIVHTHQQLRYDFTDAEQLAAGKKLGEVGQTIRRIEEELASVKSSFKYKLDEQEAIKGKLENQVTTGYEHRLVPCTVVLNKPKSGKKTITRDDTGAVVAVEDMTYDERQEQLRLDEPAPKPTEFKGAQVLPDEKAEAIETILETEQK